MKRGRLKRQAIIRKLNKEILYDISGYNRYGVNRGGFDRWGYNKNGYDSKGYNNCGFDKNMYQECGYDIDGYNKEGYDMDGYDKYGFNSSGQDKKIVDILIDERSLFEIFGEDLYPDVDFVNN